MNRRQALHAITATGVVASVTPWKLMANQRLGIAPMSGFSTEQLARMHATMSGFVTRGELPGLVTLISHGGEVHVEALGVKSLGSNEPMRRDTLFRIFSLTKPITAVATMILVEAGKLHLDDAIDQWIPELANRRVLKRIDAQLDDTVPAKRSITVRDLLTFCMGFGSIMEKPNTYPIQTAMSDQHIGGDGPPNPMKAPSTEEWLHRFAALPLMYQPGERWMYNTSADVLAILIARVSGKAFDVFLRENIFDPLHMKDTDFHVPVNKLHRLASSYVYNAQNTAQLYDGVKDSQWSRPPPFPSGSGGLGGLVSTVDDYFAFCKMMLGKGLYDAQSKTRILSPTSIELMTQDQLTPQQKTGAEPFFGKYKSWGLGMAVNIRRDEYGGAIGRFGWDGGSGTSAYTDPKQDLIGILMTQRMMTSPEPPPVFVDFWKSAYRAIEK